MALWKSPPYFKVVLSAILKDQTHFYMCSQRTQKGYFLVTLQSYLTHLCHHSYFLAKPPFIFFLLRSPLEKNQEIAQDIISVRILTVKTRPYT